MSLSPVLSLDQVAAKIAAIKFHDHQRKSLKVPLPLPVPVLRWFTAMSAIQRRVFPPGILNFIENSPSVSATQILMWY
jgi:hypothetical protein